MSLLKPQGVKITLGDKEYELLFTLNAIDQIQEESGATLQEAVGALTDPDAVVKTLRMMTRILVNDYLERTEQENPEYLTDKTVGWLVTLENQGDVLVKILKAYGLSMPEGEDDEEDEEPGETEATARNSGWRSFWLWRPLRWVCRKLKHSA